MPRNEAEANHDADDNKHNGADDHDNYDSNNDDNNADDHDNADNNNDDANGSA